ncbi:MULTISPECIES: hypothetical protein [unclassified Isoptericola]|uniref:hypothetical protein n=1 Tax=unclassified Isoptericola TaxID=2623355 RepID=UPI002712D179|nr:MULTISPECIES: hypothetical protein [unclassified Isoptericola]MDO8144389.1 hypothetical protein [Isoptericola sp. 178]MDO8148243.1 hypothetical protein [Isoptericola sp. b515]MDO8151724.1 hypothetical protein [Isoptericola sp. b408]
MKETEVERRFADHLTAQGWKVTLDDPGYVDVIAKRPEERTLVAETTGHTSSPGLDVDTMFGQLLRRMTDLSGATRYAVVVPEDVVPKVRRIPPEVLRTLRIEVWCVPASGAPERIDE